MANWSDLKAAVASIVKTNGNKEITGQLLQNVLNNIISNVGLNSSFAGIATPETNPGTPDGNVFYLATTAGTYSNFNGIVIEADEAVILEWKGSWTKKISGFATQEKLSELGSELGLLVNTETKILYNADTSMFVKNINLKKDDIIKLRVNGDYAGLVFVHEGTYRLVPEMEANKEYEVKLTKDVTSLSLANYTGSEISVSLSYTINGALQKIEKLNLTKVDKEEGKGLSSNDFTDNYKQVTEDLSLITTLSKNLFNPLSLGVVLGKGLYGNDWFVGNFNTTDYISCKPDTKYVYSQNGAYSEARWTTFFDADKNVIKFNQSSTSFTTPSNAVYFRAAVSLDKWDKFQIEEGGSCSDYEEYNPVLNGDKIKNHSIKTASLRGSVGVNLIDIHAEDVLIGTFVSGSTIQSAPTINTTGYIEVKQNTEYTFSCNGGYALMRFVTLYDKDKNVISSSPNVRSVTTTDMTYYLQISIHVRWWMFSQLNEGTVLPYVTYEESAIESKKTHEGFNGRVLTEYDTVSSGKSITIFRSHVGKNYTLSALMEGSISKVSLRTGDSKNDGYTAILTSSKIEIYSNENGSFDMMNTLSMG